MEATTDFTVLKITPELATRILLRNKCVVEEEDNGKNLVLKNRPVRCKHVDFLAVQMMDGLWRLNGETIKLNGDLIIDGQHRLHAVVKAGVPIYTYVLYGADKKTFSTLDIGRKRSAADVIYADGDLSAVESTCVAGTLLWIMQVERGEFTHTIQPSNQEYLGRYHKSKSQVVESVRFMLSFKSSLFLINRNICAALHYLFALKNIDLANDFFEKFLYGSNLAVNDVILLARRVCIRDNSSVKKYTNFVKLQMLMRAWNSIRKGRPIKTERGLVRADTKIEIII